MPRVLKIGLALTLVAGVAASTLLFAVDRFLSAPISVAEAGEELVIRPGSAFSVVSDELAARGVISHPTWFRLYARMTGDAGNIHAGEYHLAADTTPRELIQQFVAGDVRLYSFTIVPGWTYRELLAALAADEIVESTLDYEDWPAFLDTLGSGDEHPEGLFLPETYHFPRGTRDVDILVQARSLMQEVLDEEWGRRANNLPLKSAYEALILASIIEKETALESERAEIGGVFVRRMLAGMRLQTDPTVIYGLGESFDGNLTRLHLRTDTPYNTYTRGGLPPTPIALPGRAAVHAALNPKDGTAMYFVATGLGDGSHKFSATKDEHDQAVREYLARRRASATP